MSLDPIVVSVDVPLSPADAHRLFTEGMTTWWPLASHSIFEDRAAAVRFPVQAGEPILERLTNAPGNGAPIGGLKVVTEHGWFAARPSGTEDVYKIYAESFLGADHLAALQTDARSVVSRALGR